MIDIPSYGIGLSVFIHIKKNNTVAGDHSLSYIILSLPRGKSFEFIIQGEVDPFTCLVVPWPLTAVAAAGCQYVL